jgi:CubicO group peptidase (beta-lactamase class C family)
MTELSIPSLTRRVAGVMELGITEGRVLGSSCIIIRDGEVLAKIIRGAAKLNGEALREDHIFRMASMTKNIAAVSVLQQLEQARLGIDTAISRFFPGFSQKWIGRINDAGEAVPDRPAETPITIKHLVTHTSGLGSGLVGQRYKTPNETIATAADYYERDALLDFEPGTKWGYSGLAAFDILCRIVELLSDMPYADYVRKYITGPLNMPDTVFVPDESQWSRMVDVLDRDADGKAVMHGASVGRMLFGVPLTYHSGGGCMCGTLGDYARFAEMLRREGELDGARVLSKESVRVMRTPLIPQGMEGMFFPQMTFGVCCLVRKGFTHIPDGCFGWGGHYGTYTWVDPENRISVVWMKNSVVQDTVTSPTGEFAFEAAVYNTVYRRA